MTTYPHPFANIIHEAPATARRSRIRPLDGGGYMPDPDGLPAWIIAVWDGERLADSAAVPDAAPLRVFTLRGGTPFLGHTAYDHAEFHREPLRLVRDPRQWLAQGGAGIAVIDWHLAPPRLVMLREIICDDAQHAEQVRDNLKPWGKVPRLRFPRVAA